jgi:hypothetical protein
MCANLQANPDVNLFALQLAADCRRLRKKELKTGY